MSTSNESYIAKAIEFASNNIDAHGGPFGAIVVLNNEIVGVGVNTVTKDCDPTAHAEINAIKNAAKHLKTFDLKGCVIYSSCEPCPMCMSAIYWARIDNIFFASNRNDADNAGFSDDFIYRELSLDFDKRSIHFHQIERERALTVFDKWKQKTDKTLY